MMTKTKMHSPLTLVDSLMKQASDAQELYRTASQEKVDYVVGKAAEKLTSHSMHLAKLAQKETGFGNAEDKNIKIYLPVKYYITVSKICRRLES